MHIEATVIKAYDLFCFADDEEIASYGELQALVYDKQDRRHYQWYDPPCFTVVREHLRNVTWAPKVKAVVHQYMNVHNIEVLVIVTDESAYAYLY